MSKTMDRGTKHPSVLFVTPAWQRFNLSRICLAQHANVHKALSEKGIQSTSVVIADDENLEIADELGFLTVEAPNDPAFLGKKFNDGIEVGGSKGFTYVMPIGSDSWIDPQLVLKKIAIGEQAKRDALVTNQFYRVYQYNGTRMINLRVAWGVGQLIPTHITAQSDHRPCREDIPKGIDTSIRNHTIGASGEKLIKMTLHPLEYIGWRTDGVQITTYGRASSFRGAKETRGPVSTLLAPLRPIYTDGAVDQMEEHFTNLRLMHQEKLKATRGI